MSTAASTSPPVPAAEVAAKRWLPSFLILAVIWGSSYLFIKVGVQELHPLHLSLFRVAIGASTLLVILAATRDRLPSDLRLWMHLFVVAGIGVALPFTLFGYGEQRVDSTLAGLWNATTPLIVLPMAVLVFRTERLTLNRVIGLLLGFSGVLVLLGIWQGVDGTQLTGQLMCFAAAACYGVGIPYQKRFVTGGAQSGVALAAAQLILATGQLTIIAPLVAGPPPLPWTLSGNVIASVAALGALGTGIAFIFMFRTIRLAGASTASMVTYLIPLVATLMGVLVLREQLSWHQPVGGLIVLAGVAVSQGLFSRHRRVEVTAAGTGDPPRIIASEAGACQDCADEEPDQGRTRRLLVRPDQVGVTSEKPPARNASTNSA
ncbi:MAG: DMT family transporter [Actinomycetota bacterium]|nr:DMT family transporter [Actinomycetota bacterium]